MVKLKIASRTSKEWKVNLSTRLGCNFKRLADQFIQGGLMRQLFDVATILLDDMTKINRATSTREDQLSSLHLGMSKEKMEKINQHDENMTKMMTQHDLLSKLVSAEALAKLRSLEESIVQAMLERSHLKISAIGTRGICLSESTIPPSNMPSNNSPIEATLLPTTSDVPVTNARIDAISSKSQD
ncbi:hypothetical protein MTR67_026609 [Solanum verrucosum]|uniref:Uncharacterized protein n=1 Tax=Solanum verrucosum TaxID=315347 RepID=A0AAF0QZ91_SOLVR|nr:hypothetical protein MTR67_026609 [Solanum verrucosum]